jgi:hypothetical protein
LRHRDPGGDAERRVGAKVWYFKRKVMVPEAVAVALMVESTHADLHGRPFA